MRVHRHLGRARSRGIAVRNISFRRIAFRRTAFRKIDQFRTSGRILRDKPAPISEVGQPPVSEGRRHGGIHPLDSLFLPYIRAADVGRRLDIRVRHSSGI
ncbi:hypothetical protein GOSPT_003_00240 [Gordonia sputi NBRC 100414]|uniref:Uncharacterized protein n=1 Tax=Gordonia sputi NBRC 100414 TaxID=1089453 RepID=H5TUM7_9ACTN|nr:hypothetical protein GOSPT_003_00240 [Gordonia sputi NBRC 100414]